MTRGHVLIQATRWRLAFPLSTPYSIRLFSNMPTRHGSAATKEEEGGRGVGGLRDGGGDVGV